ncbi:hypothetical protein [Acinetobacter gerneri]
MNLSSYEAKAMKNEIGILYPEDFPISLQTYMYVDSCFKRS